MTAASTTMVTSIQRLGTAMDQYTQVWQSWEQWHQPIMRTIEQEQAYQDRLQAQREERSRRLLAEKARLEGAQDRALVLLESLVSEDERPLEELIQLVGSDGQLYRIEMHRDTVHGNIVRVDEHGCILGRACVAPAMYDQDAGLALPLADGWVGQYLGLKHDAEGFLSRANWSGMRGCQQPRAVVPLAA
jgi:hypothetical protein